MWIILNLTFIQVMFNNWNSNVGMMNAFEKEKNTAKYNGNFEHIDRLTGEEEKAEQVFKKEE